MTSIPMNRIFPVAAVAVLLLALVPAMGAEAAPSVSGVVLASTRASPTEGSYLLGADSGVGEGQLVGGRGASFAFQAFAGVVPAYNAQSSNDVAYWSCGSSCGKRAILDTATSGDMSPVTCSDPARYTGECSSRSEAAAAWTPFSASDAPLKASEFTSASTKGEFLHLPLAIGTVTLAYNLANCGSGDVKLTAAQVDKIMRGVLTNWNDAELVAGNDCLATENTPIQPVVRCDGSGTTFVFTDWLARTVGAPWTAQEPSPTTYAFKAPNMICGPQNPGVAAQIQAARGRIGYVELAQAKASGLTHALMQNGDETNYVEATEQTGANAAIGKAPTLPASHADWSRVSIVAALGVESYPITSFTYVMTWATPWTLTSASGAFKDLHTADQYAALRDFLAYANSDAGQSNLPDGYSALPDEVQALNAAGLARMAYGERTTFTVGGLPGDKSVLDQGLPTVGIRGTHLDGVFHPDASAYKPAANSPVTVVENGATLRYVEVSGTVLVLGGVVSTDGGIVGKVAAGRSIPNGVYGAVKGQLVDGVLLVHAVA